MCTSVTKRPAMPGNFGKSRLALTCMEVGIDEYTSPFGLPLRVDLPTVDPTEWEDEEEDGD
jgi:hypothetical protein